MASFHARNGPGELLARYSFIEPLLDGRRVLEIGAARDTGGASALFLAERGAAAVLSIEPSEADLEAARGAGHHPFVQFQAMGVDALRPGAFDLVLLADAAAVAPDWVAGLRRLLAPGGRLVTAVAAGGVGLWDLVGDPAQAEPPAYETFVNALSDHFGMVEVAAQSATAGWVFGLPSSQEPEIAMDGTLAGTAETTRYLAIAGDEPSGLSGFTVVALPVAPFLETVREKSQQEKAAREHLAEVEASARAKAEVLAAERARSAEQAAALAAVEVERDAARSAREAAIEEAEALRAQREEAIRAREAALSELAAAAVERDRAVEVAARLEAEQASLREEREAARAREQEAQRARELAVAEAVALGESLARSEALVHELASDREAAVQARDKVAAEAAELRMTVDEARLAQGSLEAQLVKAHGEAARLAGKAQELEEIGVARARAEAERQGEELRKALEEVRAEAAGKEEELAATRSALSAAEEERARLEAALAARRTSALEAEAGLQASRSEAQAARAALEAALDRATRAEARAAELEDALEKAPPGLEPPAAEGVVERAAVAEGELLGLREELERLRSERVGPPAEELEALRARAAIAGELEARVAAAEALSAQLAEAVSAREALQKRMDELRDGAERKVAEARRAAYEAAAKAEAARTDAEAAREELKTVQAGAEGAAETAREWAQLREALEARVAELEARLEAEAERAGILSAQAAEARAQLETVEERAAPGDGESQAAEARVEDLAQRAVVAEARARELDAVAARGGEESGPEAELKRELAVLREGRAALEKELSEAQSAADAAAAQVAEIAAELQAVRWEKDDVEQRLKTSQVGAAGTTDATRLRDELAARMAELALQRREVERLEAVVASLSVRTEAAPPSSAPELEEQLTQALQRAADAEAALGAARAGVSGEQGDTLRKAVLEREAMAGQLSERDAKIARLQREVADKTERLGRLAKELGEMKAKGLGKIFR